MDAENNFLELLPINSRKEVKKAWYKGSILTALKLKLINEYNRIFGSGIMIASADELPPSQIIT